MCPREFLDLTDRVLNAEGDVLVGGFDRCWCLAGDVEAPYAVLLVEESGLCRGASDVCRENILHILDWFLEGRHRDSEMC